MTLKKKLKKTDGRGGGPEMAFQSRNMMGHVEWKSRTLFGMRQMHILIDMQDNTEMDVGSPFTLTNMIFLGQHTGENFLASLLCGCKIIKKSHLTTLWNENVFVKWPLSKLAEETQQRSSAPN